MRRFYTTQGFRKEAGDGDGDGADVVTLKREDLKEVLAEATAEGREAGLKEAGAGRVDRSGVVGAGAGSREEERSQFQVDLGVVSGAISSRMGWEAQLARQPEWYRKVMTPENIVACQRYLEACLDGEKSTARMIAGEMGWLGRFKVPEGHRVDDSGVFARALGTTPDSAGGFLTPQPLADILIVKRDKRERVGPRCLNVTSESTSLDIPGEATVGAIQPHPENQAQTETDSTFQNTALRKKNHSRIVKTSRQLATDISAAFSLVTILTNQFARKFAALWDVQSATGDGTGENFTLGLEAATIGTVAGTGGALTRRKVVNLKNGLPSEWRDGGGAVFMGNENVVGFLSELEDGTGRPIYSMQNAPAVPVGDTLMENVTNIVEGIPLIEVQFAADILMVGLLSEGFAQLRDASMLVEATTEGMGAFEAHQVAWKAFERRDGAVVEPDAFRQTDLAVTAPA